MKILIYAISRYIFQLTTSKLGHLHEHCSLRIFTETKITVVVRCSRPGSNTWVSRAPTFLLSQLKHTTSLFTAAVRVGSGHSNAASGAPEYRRSFNFRSKTDELNEQILSIKASLHPVDIFMTCTSCMKMRPSTFHS